MEGCDEVYRRLMCDPNYQIFYNHVTDKILESPPFQRIYGNTEHPKIARSYCVAITSMYRAWLSGGREFPLDELIAYAGKLVMYGFEGVGVGE